MICPNKACTAEIPEDSCFCDQCGMQLSKCDKCGSIGITKRCGKCGGFMIPIKSDSSTTFSGQQLQSSNQPSSFNNPVPPVAPVFTKTISTPTVSSTIELSYGSTMILEESKAYELVHSEGWSLPIVSGNIFGRVTGNYVSQLGRFNTISSRHAQVTLKDDKCFITDLGSTNGTLINGNRIAPNTPTEIKEDDTVVFADVSFTVRVK